MIVYWTDNSIGWHARGIDMGCIHLLSQWMFLGSVYKATCGMEVRDVFF